jgi:hypothetical protein
VVVELRSASLPLELAFHSAIFGSTDCGVQALCASGLNPPGNGAGALSVWPQSAGKWCRRSVRLASIRRDMVHVAPSIFLRECWLLWACCLGDVNAGAAAALGTAAERSRSVRPAPRCFLGVWC